MPKSNSNEYYNLNPISSKKQQKLDEFNNAPYLVGDLVYIIENGKEKLFKIHTIDGDNLMVFESGYDYQPHAVKKSDIVERLDMFVGEDPFPKEKLYIKSINYSLESIISTLDLMNERRPIEINGTPVMRANFNPFVYNKQGGKEYFQRPLVWSVKDKQMLIESIYQNIDCGKILVRERGWNEVEALQKKGETELSFKDVIDGKQRLHAIKSFIQLEFTDLNGNLFSDLSKSAQNRMLDHQLFSYSELPENSKDEDVLSQFLKLNFAGVPQSQEHIEFVKSLQNKI